MNIELLPDSDPENVLAKRIRVLLVDAPQELKHGDEFTGRPTTRIYATDDCVAKVHVESGMDRAAAVREASTHADLERRLGIYHPDKCWFVYEENGSWCTGNITPRLLPLHIVLADDSERDPGNKLILLTHMLDLYLRVLLTHGYRLDEGLSNYAVDDADRLYYLDDDLYRYDDLVGLSYGLSKLFRSLKWLQPGHVTALAETIRVRFGDVDGDTGHMHILQDLMSQLGGGNQAGELLTGVFCGSLASLKPFPYLADWPQKTRYVAILGDVHANYYALTAVLDYLSDHDIVSGIMLGDYVGYGPHPEECLTCLRGLEGFSFILGNHDNVLLGTEPEFFSRMARWSADWSRDRVSADAISWLGQLPPVIHGNNWMAVHGAPVDATYFNAYVYDRTYERNLTKLEELGVHLCFHGHTHIQGLYGRNPFGIDHHSTSESSDLQQYGRVLVCPGSLGQPRGGSREAEFAILDRETCGITFHKLEYPIEKTVRDMRNYDFPPELIARLEQGR
jgi:predicted phosphodiesterase